MQHHHFQEEIHLPMVGFRWLCWFSRRYSLKFGKKTWLRDDCRVYQPGASGCGGNQTEVPWHAAGEWVAMASWWQWFLDCGVMFLSSLITGESADQFFFCELNWLQSYWTWVFCFFANTFKQHIMGRHQGKHFAVNPLVPISILLRWVQTFPTFSGFPPHGLVSVRMDLLRSFS